jgi:hypothetical protein
MLLKGNELAVISVTPLPSLDNPNTLKFGKALLDTGKLCSGL